MTGEFKAIGDTGRGNLDSITIGFSTTTKWISRLIRWITGAKVSHAWIGYYDETLSQRMVMQAEMWGYEVRPWSRWLSQNMWVSEFIVPNRSHALIALQNIATYLGVRYDFGSAFFLGIRGWLGRFFKIPYRDPGKLMCSEAVVRFLKLGGYEVVSKMDPETTSPGYLLDKVRTDKSFISLRKPEAIKKPSL